LPHHPSRFAVEELRGYKASPAIEDRNLLFFWQPFLQTQVLNLESGIRHCGSAALRYVFPSSCQGDDGARPYL
jgi:hypothetical protein